MRTNLGRPERALAIGAHPDDIEFGCGATLAKWAAAGTEIFHLVCTDGSKGSWDPAADIETLIATRQAEQRAASVALGGRGEVVFLGFPDGELQAGLDQRQAVCGVIRRLQPDVVLGHDPWKRYRLHPDHRHAGFLTTDAIVAARDPHFFPSLDLAPHRPDALLLWEADDPDHVEDVTGFVEIKFEALMSHSSQLRSTMGIGTLDEGQDRRREVEDFRSRIEHGLAEVGTQAGVDYGEAFKLVDRL